MSSRPSAVQFAQWSQYLAYATSAIMLLALILNWAGTPFGAIVWFAFLTSAAGAFMGWAARRDFKAQPGPEDAMLMARRGWRTNLIAFILLTVMLLGVIIFGAILSQPQVVPGAEPTPSALVTVIRI